MSLTEQNPVQDAVSPPQETQLENPLNRFVGITEAASMTGRNKGRISIDTNGGKLPFTLNEQGHKRYKVSDLYQLYGLHNPKAASSRDVPKPSEEPTGTAVETAVELALLRQQVQTLKQENDHLRQIEERLWKQNEQLSGRLLAAPQPATASTPPAEPQAGAAPPAPKSFWQRITGQ